MTMSEGPMFAIFLTAILLGIGAISARFILPADEAAKNNIYYGRTFAGYMAVLASISSFPVFYGVTLEEALARYVLFMLAFPLLAFFLGCLFGMFKTTTGIDKPEKSIFSSIPESLKSSNFQPFRQTAPDLTNGIGAAIGSEKLEECAYAKAYEEIESEKIKKGIWAKALVESEGDIPRTRLYYLKYRVPQIYEQLLQEENAKLQAANSTDTFKYRDEQYNANDGASLDVNSQMVNEIQEERAQEFSSDKPWFESKELTPKFDRYELRNFYEKAKNNNDYDSKMILIRFLGGVVSINESSNFRVTFLGIVSEMADQVEFADFCEKVVYPYVEECLR
jgi:hypothetical protein